MIGTQPDVMCGATSQADGRKRSSSSREYSTSSFSPYLSRVRNVVQCGATPRGAEWK